MLQFGPITSKVGTVSFLNDRQIQAPFTEWNY